MSLDTRSREKKQVVFFHVSNREIENEILRIDNLQEQQKYQKPRNKSHKKSKTHYFENHKTLLRENKDLKKWKAIPYS